MQVKSLAVRLLFCSLVSAAPSQPNNACKAPGGPPEINSLSTLQALKYNNLGSENNGESLYSLQDATETNRTELQYQFNYLIHNRDLQRSDQVWVAKSSSKDCSAYSLSRKETVSIPCHMQLPALCTSKVPPTTDTNKAVVESSKISVMHEGYTFTGYRDARSFRFLGVPFANPPVKDLRFAPPQPYSGPKTLDATKFSDSCVQSVSGFGTLGNGGVSEDCLYLNIYTPVLPAHGARNSLRKPVAVYFYGGAFTKGSASMIDYDGGNFASRNDVVVVTVNYRLGALGWLATGSLTTGSYGIRDQILALEWINEYIEAFGGDKSRITIFGQSAGGQSVTALLSSSAAKGLFSGAIVQSAPLDLPWFTREVYEEVVTPGVAKAVGCNQTVSEEKLLACLRSVPASAFLDNTTEFQSAMTAVNKKVADSFLHVSTMLASIEPLMPMVDDSGSGVIDDQFYTLLADNTLPNRVPTLFTTVTDEAALYVGRFVPQIEASTTNLHLLFGVAYPADLAKSLAASNAFPLDPSDPDTVRNVGAQALTYSEWTCPQAHLLANGGATAFPALYELEITRGHIQTNAGVPAVCSPNTDYNATCHAADVLPVWGTLNSKSRNVDPYYDTTDLLHSQLLDDVFGAFFRTRSPNPDPEMLRVRGPAYAATYEIFGKNGYYIPPYHPQQRNVSLLDMPPAWTQNPHGTDKCKVFEEYGFTFQRASLA
ncbi:putative cholinesterase [Aspergillus novofumigatus IBT 16806]|uniref:Putative cholinesterase n=1 Tax=Aspergillus novofumigatus (strain IBT 16806) TaxID=1392255 RepID=A0A2I1BY98_ASPN1|nr:putative cholinesterase [Aspergillus novofumigatus IBT 16806]PKX90350.1 putative cholinesterase [Aspergillus novofumigatus IBT 16806]